MGTRLSKIDILIPGSNLDAYIQAVNSIPVLAVERERELSAKLYYENDLDAARQLVLSHLRFVVYVAKSYSGYGLAEADLIQEGNVGLMKAVRRFNPEFGVRMVSFAVHWIKAEIHEFILRNWRIVKVATTKAQRKLFFNLRKAKKRLGWFSKEEAENVAKSLGVEPHIVRLMEGRLGAVDESYDGGLEEATRDSQQSPAKPPPSLFLEDQSANPATIVEKQKTDAAGLKNLKNALSLLDQRSADIITQRWLTEQKTTLHQLATKYGISAERVRQLEKNALGKLRLTMEV